MHFRIGDYKQLPGHYEILSYEYYERSIRFILQKWKRREKRRAKPTSNVENYKKNSKSVLYFCEEKDLKEVSPMIEKLQQVFPEMVFVKAPDNWEDWEQLLLMSCYNNHIIANSTFSWWGAYLNQEPNSIVCYPSVWFGPKNVYLDTKDLPLSNELWQKI